MIKKMKTLSLNQIIFIFKKNTKSLEKLLGFPNLLLLSIPYMLLLNNNLNMLIFHNIIFVFFIFAINLLLLFINKRGYSIFANLILSVFLIFFYGNIFYRPIQNYILTYFHVYLNGKMIMSILLFFIFFYLSFEKIKSYFYFNIYFIILSFVYVFSTFDSNKINFQPKSKVATEIRAEFKKNSNSVFLIVLDEYSLVESTSDSVFFTSLRKNKWVTRNKIHSNEISTILSISSLFNFNESEIYKTNTQSIDTDLNKIYYANNKLKNSYFINKLYKAGVQIKNFSFFDLPKNKAFAQIYKIPKNDFQKYLTYTIYSQIVNNISEFDIKNENIDVTNEYNNLILSNLRSALLNPENNTFYYFHVFMPHYPFYFQPVTFNYNKKFDYLSNNHENYLLYKNFLNELLFSILNKRNQNCSCKLILVGDHGFRAANENRMFSSIATFGYSEDSIKSLKSIQDIGKLISQDY